MTTDLSLYIHIPFCVRKCRYCDFLSFPADDEARRAYVDLLLNEIADTSHKYSDRRVTSIYIGGGTPSILPAGWISRIMECIRKCYLVSPEAECSIEINPGTVDLCKLMEYHNSGINRISFGLQSVNDSELMRIGRIHSFADFEKSYELALQAGFDNINIDVISALPGQKLQDYEKTLNTVLGFKPAHISAYSMQLEEGTYFFDHRDEYEWPSEELDRDLYHLTKEVLASAGYERYEISNYALKDRRCRHNCVYWTGGEYLGLGLGSSSYVNHIRFKNTSDMSMYGYAPYEEVTVLDKKDMMEEFMFLGLRMTEGVSPETFKERFGTDIRGVYGDMTDRLADEGLIVCDDRIRLTDFGMDVSNYVFEKFLLD